MVTVKCLHCDAENDAHATHGFCDACGKRLPPSAEFRSRRGPIGSGGEEAPPEVAAPPPRLQAFEAMLTITVLQLVASGLFLVLGPVIFSNLPEEFPAKVILLSVPPLVTFGTLSFVARRWALFASLTGAVLHLFGSAGTFVVSVPLAVRYLPISLFILALFAWPILVSLRPSGRSRRARYQ